MLRRIKSSLFVSALSSLLLLSGCATSDPNQDPLESLNRDIYSFNHAVDKVIVNPILYVYQGVLPNFVERGVSNFFDNLRDIPTIANDMLQLKPGHAVKDTTRFLLNSTVGLLGVIDVAGAIGVEKHKEDFGQTLYVYGMRNSTYLVLPFFGPSTVRDTIGFAVDYSAFSVWPRIESESSRNWLLALDYIDQKSRFSRHGKVLEAVGIDEYAFVRNAYLQRRAFLSYDGNLPEEDLDQNPFPGDMHKSDRTPEQVQEDADRDNVVE
jgi:phospholipid-binding lipoprotein MlaA